MNILSALPPAHVLRFISMSSVESVRPPSLIFNRSGPHIVPPQSLSTESGTDTGTGSSLSYAPGPGALAGKLVKWLGETSLDAIVLLIVHTRLSAIKRIVRERPRMFTGTTSSVELCEVSRIHDDLKDLCRKVPLRVRQKAARLVLEIAFLVHLRQFDSFSELSDSLSSMGGKWFAVFRFHSL
ncbi:hypothetical protein K439DRAFT_878462 [Ramaria rubella]|nr:hypothetical protein K439DRAFT_878462 [Ramaria rubella]